MNKKRLFKIWLALVLLSVSLQIGFAMIHKVQGDSNSVQHRLYKMEHGKKVFNWSGLLSFSQVTALKVVKDEKTFTERVQYPKAPKFDLVAPTYNAEKFVADKITRTIKDSLKKMTYNHSFDYDGQSFKVLQAKDLKMPRIPQPTIEMKLKGTASPEAKKYGYEASLQVGHRELENQKLAEARMTRTADSLKKNFSGISFKITKREAEELQLKDSTEIGKVLKDPSLLGKMRYVEAKIKIISYHVKVIPCPSPVVPLLLLGLLFLSFPKWKRRPSTLVAEERELERERTFMSGDEYVGRLILLVVAMLIAFWILFVLRDYMWWILLAGVIGTIVYFLIRNIGRPISLAFPNPPPWWRRFITWVREGWQTFLDLWRRGIICRTLLILLILFIIISRLCGWWHWDGW